jgi:aspartate-semialdehyde dehydrogenase
MSTELANLEVKECKASNFQDCDLVFSGLDSDVAGDIGAPNPCFVFEMIDY